MTALLHTAFAVAHQVGAKIDPNQGSAAATKGAALRLQEPDYYDIVSPVVAFVLVIILPSVVALWAIYKTLTEKPSEA